MGSSDLWYPGRIPLCTPQVIRSLEHYLETLRRMVVYQDPNLISTAARIHEEIHNVLYAEGLDCLGSDTDINSLLTLMLRSQQAVELCAENDCWEDLDEVIDAIDTVRWSLIMKQDAGGTDGGEEPGAVATPDPDSGTAGWPHREEDPGETNRIDHPGDQQEIEEALLGSDEEDEEEELITDEKLTFGLES